MRNMRSISGHVSLLQGIGWDSPATLQNWSQGGVTPLGVETASAATFNAALNYSDNYPVNSNDLNLVSTHHLIVDRGH